MFSFAASAGLVYLALVAWPLATSDARERRLPNRLVLPGFAVALAGQLLACGVLGAPWWRLLAALFLAAGVFAVSLWMSRSGALGMGDVKLLTLIALALGWFSACLVAAVVAAGFALSILHIAFKRRQVRERGIPLGTYLMAGFAVCLPALAPWG